MNWSETKRSEAYILEGKDLWPWRHVDPRESVGEFAGTQSQEAGSSVWGAVRLGPAAFLPGGGLGAGIRDKGASPGSCASGHHADEAGPGEARGPFRLIVSGDLLPKGASEVHVFILLRFWLGGRATGAGEGPGREGRLECPQCAQV